MEQSVLGRILGYGTIVINGTGGTKEPFKRIASPFDFRKHVQEQNSSPYGRPSGRVESRG